jgi:hypothetical protein
MNIDFSGNSLFVGRAIYLHTETFLNQTSSLALRFQTWIQEGYIGHSDWSSCMFFSVPPDNFQGSISITPLPLPAKILCNSSLINHSTIRHYVPRLSYYERCKINQYKENIQLGNMNKYVWSVHTQIASPYSNNFTCYRNSEPKQET